MALAANAVCVTLVAAAGFGRSTWVLGLSGVVAILLYSAIVGRELRDGMPSLPTPYVVVATSMLVRNGIGVIYVAMLLLSEQEGVLVIGQFLAGDYVVTGYALLLWGDFFLLSGLAATNRQVDQSSDRLRGRVSWEDSVWFFVGLAVVWGGRILLAGDIVPAGGQRIVNAVDSYGIPALVLLYGWGVLVAWEREPSRWTHLLIRLTLLGTVLGGEVYWQLSSYMRQDVLVPILPVLFLGWVACRRELMPLRVFASVLVAAALAVSFLLWPYAQERRPAAWVDGQRLEVRDVPVMPYLALALSASVPGSEEWKALHVFPTGGAWGVLARAQQVTPAAISLQLAADRGEQGRDFAFLGVQNLVPRLIWNDKPIFSPGTHVAVALGQASSPSQATTATALSLVGVKAWMIGPVLGAMSLVIVGLIVGFCWRLLHHRWQGNPAAAVGLLIIWTQCIRLFESTTDWGLGLAIFLVLFWVPAAHLWSALTKHSRNDSKSFDSSPRAESTPSRHSDALGRA